MHWRRGPSVAAGSYGHVFHALTHTPHLQFLQTLFQVSDVLPSFFNLSIKTLLDLGVGALAHSNSRIDEDLFPLDLAVDLVHKGIIVIHDGGNLRVTTKKVTDLKRFVGLCFEAVRA